MDKKNKKLNNDALRAFRLKSNYKITGQTPVAGQTMLSLIFLVGGVIITTGIALSILAISFLTSIADSENIFPSIHKARLKEC